MIEKLFLTSLAASLHMAGLRDEELSLASQPSLGEYESRWVEDIAKCASALDDYWGRKTIPARWSAHGFKAPPRFENLQPLGHGGMGVVFSALDKNNNEKVAIKIGKSLGENSEVIKREFRTLAKIRHPNLVVLKELLQFKGNVFFTMEYIRGENFNSQSVTQTKKGKPWQPGSLANLCGRLLQLVEGIDFLHQMSFVHCDIKPSNVLVTRNNRVVILDLGLARPAEHHQNRGNNYHGGTTAYMSPEQASGEPSSPSSDWFAFGVVMYEALFGNRPFEGTAIDVLLNKLAWNTSEPLIEETGVPQRLSALCLDLLNPKAKDRPPVDSIRRCLEAYSNQPSVSVKPPVTQAPFFGRQQELAVLGRALNDSRAASQPTLLMVEGESGIGKTHLVQKFLQDCSASAELTVLTGRCYENERIPFKAIDAVISQLAAQWRALDRRDTVSAQLIDSISSVFKVFSGLSVEANPTQDASTLSHTAADGLSAILTALRSHGKHIIILIDDIQWADADSGELLAKIIRETPLLLICSQRPMQQPNQFLVNLLEDLPAPSNANRALSKLKVEPFSDDDAKQFLQRSFPGVSRQISAKAIGVSEGVPMFLTTLVQQITDNSIQTDNVEATELDWSRDLEPNAKSLLKFVCASGAPLPQRIALEAADIHEDGEVSISSLCSRRLVTLSQANDEMMLFPFHDMIRESIYSELSMSDKHELHSAIATVSEHQEGVPPDRLAFHFKEAGNHAKCCHYSILAGDVAVKSLAFDEAVRAYTTATDNFLGNDMEKQNLKQKLASALGRLGRSSDAGDLYFELASSWDGGASRHLQLAADQYCAAGRIEDALQGFNRLLKPWGYKTHQSEMSVLWRLVYNRIKLGAVVRLKSWGSLGRRRIGASSAFDKAVAVTPENVRNVLVKNSDPVEAIRIERMCDLLWDTGIALSTFDLTQAALFINYSQQVAIRQNDEVRMLRTAILLATSESFFGSRKETLVRGMLESTDTEVTRLHPYLAGVHLMATALLAFANGHWEEAVDRFTMADGTWHASHDDSSREAAATQLWGLWALQFTGQVKAAGIRYQELLDSPANREHLLNTSNLMNFCGPFVCLANDRPTEALASIDKAMEMWPVDTLCFQHIIAEYGRAEVYLYSRNYLAASEAIEKLSRKFRWSNYRIIEVMRVLLLEFRGRCAASQFKTSKGRVSKRIANQSIKKLEREKTGWARPMAQRVRACVALKNQNFESANPALIAARDGFEHHNMRLFQFTAEAKLCEITGQLNTKRFQIVQDWFESQEIKNQQALIDMHFPVGETNADRL